MTDNFSVESDNNCCRKNTCEKQREANFKKTQSDSRLSNSSRVIARHDNNRRLSNSSVSVGSTTTTSMSSMSRKCNIVGLVLLLVLVCPSVDCRPQTVKITSQDGADIDSRWDLVEQDDHQNGNNEVADNLTEYDKKDVDEKIAKVVAKAFSENKNLHKAIMDVLETLPEDDLKELEDVARSAFEQEDGGNNDDDDEEEEELPQADMPMEEFVEDGVQELAADDTGSSNADLEGYRGELLELDNVNATLASINSTLNSVNVSDTSIDDPPYPQLQKSNRERNKEMRLTTIKNQILSILWPQGTPQTNATGNQQKRIQQDTLLRAIADKMKTQTAPFPPGDVYTEKVQSFYPSCELPKNTDEELWSRSDAMNLLFDLSYPSSLQGTSVNIVAAKLRLYKLSQGNVTVTVPETCPPPVVDEAAPTTASETTKAQHKMYFPNAATFSGVEDKQIRVSIYWYTRSLKKHRVKRKLLDSQMLSVYGETWTEWNIRGAVKAWRDNGRNFGLAVEVEDEDGALLPTDKYFAPMNCSKEASTSRPIPGFLVARALAMENSQNQTNTNSSTRHTLRYDTLLFPMIDLCTIELPDSEKVDATYYQKIQDASEREFSSVTQVNKKDPNNTTAVNDVPNGTDNEMDRHRIRHYNHRHTTTVEETKPHQPRRHLETIRRDDGDSIEEITWADDIDGHQLRKKIIVQRVLKKAQKDRLDNER